MIARKPLVAALLAAALVLGCAKEEEDAAPEAGSQLNIPPRDGSLTGVTDKYGPLLVKEGEVEAESPQKPWSAWWMPLTSEYLFAGSGSTPGPLQKYDEVARRRNLQKYAAKYEKENLYDEGASTEGHIYAWALASLLYLPEPPKEREVNGVKFSRGDLKSLVVKSFDGVQPFYFGQRYRRGADGQNAEDVFPDQFHRFLQVELVGKKRPFVMDVDPGADVWAYPIYKMKSKIEKDEDDPHRFHVETTVWAADALDGNEYDRDDVKTRTFDYTYDLVGDSQPDGSLKVIYGTWTYDSESSHPDFLVPLPDQPVRRASRNPEIDPQLVDSIVR